MAYLNNEEKLEHEGHVDMWISVPEVTNAQDVLPPDDVGGPQQAEIRQKIKDRIRNLDQSG